MDQWTAGWSPAIRQHGVTLSIRVTPHVASTGEAWNYPEHRLDQKNSRAFKCNSPRSGVGMTS